MTSSSRRTDADFGSWTTLRRFARSRTKGGKSSAFLFEPEDAYNLPQPTENGTPQPKDEPLAENQPYGAIIDYYLGSRAGTVTIEILNPAGESIRKFSSDDKFPPVDPDKLDIPAFWVKAPPVLSTAEGNAPLGLGPAAYASAGTCGAPGRRWRRRGGGPPSCPEPTRSN